MDTKSVIRTAIASLTHTLNMPRVKSEYNYNLTRVVIYDVIKELSVNVNNQTLIKILKEVQYDISRSYNLVDGMLFEEHKSIDVIIQKFKKLMSFYGIRSMSPFDYESIVIGFVGSPMRLCVHDDTFINILKIVEASHLNESEDPKPEPLKLAIEKFMRSIATPCHPSDGPLTPIVVNIDGGPTPEIYVGNPVLIKILREIQAGILKSDIVPTCMVSTEMDSIGVTIDKFKELWSNYPGMRNAGWYNLHSITVLDGIRFEVYVCPDTFIKILEVIQVDRLPIIKESGCNHTVTYTPTNKYPEMPPPLDSAAPKLTDTELNGPSKEVRFKASAREFRLPITMDRSFIQFGTMSHAKYNTSMSKPHARITFDGVISRKLPIYVRDDAFIKIAREIQIDRDAGTDEPIMPLDLIDHVMLKFISVLHRVTNPDTSTGGVQIKIEYKRLSQGVIISEDSATRIINILKYEYFWDMNKHLSLDMPPPLEDATDTPEETPQIKLTPDQKIKRAVELARNGEYLVELYFQGNTKLIEVSGSTKLDALKSIFDIKSDFIHALRDDSDQATVKMIALKTDLDTIMRSILIGGKPNRLVLEIPKGTSFKLIE